MRSVHTQRRRQKINTQSLNQLSPPHPIPLGARSTKEPHRKPKERTNNLEDSFTPHHRAGSIYNARAFRDAVIRAEHAGGVDSLRAALRGSGTILLGSSFARVATIAAAGSAVFGLDPRKAVAALAYLLW